MSLFLAAYERFVASTTDAPLEFGHAGGLTCLSAIALGRRWIDRGPGIRPNIFVMLLADSSRDRKSTSVSLATELLREVEPKHVGPEDWTAEGLISMMRHRNSPKERRNRLMLPLSEFGQYLAQATKSYGQNMSPTLCKLYDGDEFERARSGKKPIRISKPRLCILGGVAYAMLEKYGDPIDWVTGLYARFIWVTPMTRPERYAMPPTPNAALRQHAVDSLNQLRIALKAKPQAMTVTQAAEQSYHRFASSFPADYPNPAFNAQRERLLTICFKIAMLYQIDIDPHAPIGSTAMDKATAFCAKAWLGFQKAYGESASSTDARTMRKIWKLLSESPEALRRREIQRATGLDVDQILAPLERLEALGYVKKKQVKANSFVFECVEPYSEDRV